jgi:hypothetical protein
MEDIISAAEALKKSQEYEYKQVIQNLETLADYVLTDPKKINGMILDAINAGHTEVTIPIVDKNGHPFHDYERNALYLIIRDAFSNKYVLDQSTIAGRISNTIKVLREHGYKLGLVYPETPAAYFIIEWGQNCLHQN